MGELPQNLSVAYHRGSKSFAEVLQGQKRKAWKEAPKGEQLSEKDFETIFQTALGLAETNPTSHIHYTRYDLEATSIETESNRPFREGAMIKAINLFGRFFHSEIGGKHD